MKLVIYGLVLVGISAGLLACGETRGDRALSGAAIGAGTGAAVGGVAGGPVGAGRGAAIGAGAGAATGAVTSPNTVDLGRPAWDR
jgi:osmotically inducible lipoprotein OsmB